MTSSNAVRRLPNLRVYNHTGSKEAILSDEQRTKAEQTRLKDWITFYRHNMSFFVEHYLGITLYLYQRLWITWIASSTNFLGVASRASAKSWLIAVYSIAKSILYPGSRIVLASSTKQQAGLIISQHARSLYDNHPNVRREIKSITTNQNTYEIRFKNGSFVTVVVSGESGRGNRANVLVLEERRLIPKETIDEILRPFAITRQPPYLKNAKYARMAEEPQEIIITSAYYKSYDWYPEAKSLIKKIVAGDNRIKAIFLDYNILLRHGIRTKRKMESERELFDPISFLMEYGNIPFGESSMAFFKLDLFNRNIKRAWRPITTEDFLTKKKNAYDIPKRPEEVRLVGVDIAMRAGSATDNTIISCARLFPSKKGYQIDYSYMESHNGRNTLEQALRIKQICHEFEADAMILDIANAGISIYDAMSQVTKDDTRGVEYPAYTVLPLNEIEKGLYEDLSNRTLAKDAVPFIFPIVATQQINSEIAVTFREKLKSKMINFLVDDNTAEEFLIKSGNKDIIDQNAPERRAYLLQPHLQTTLAINETISLDMDTTGAAGLIKLVEPPGGRKDRYSSMSYLCYYVSILDRGILQDNYTAYEDELEFLNSFQLA